MRAAVRSLGAVAIAFALSGCGQEWKGIVYPAKSDSANEIVIGEFANLKECRAAARIRLKELNAEALGSYQCGKRCVLELTSGRWACELSEI